MACSPFKDQESAYAFPGNIGGKKDDLCLGIHPTERGDRFKVFAGPHEKDVNRYTGDLFLHSLRTRVHGKASGALAHFLAGGKRRTEGEFFMVNSEVGLTLLKVFPGGGLDVILWAPRKTEP